jgi:hypothetical protein
VYNHFDRRSDERHRQHQRRMNESIMIGYFILVVLVIWGVADECAHRAPTAVPVTIELTK